MDEAVALLRLQDLDLILWKELAQYKKLSNPSRLAVIATAEKKVKAALIKLTGERKDIEIDIEDMNKELATIEERLEATRMRAEGADYHEQQDLEVQMTSLMKRSERISYNKRPQLERLSKVSQAEAQAVKTLEDLKLEREKVKSEAERKTLELRGHIAQLKEQRDQMLVLIDEKTLETYNKASKRFSGLAVEVLHGNKPSICNVTLAPSSYSDIIHRGQDICECPYCHRMLVVNEDAAAEAAALSEE